MTYRLLNYIMYTLDNGDLVMFEKKDMLIKYTRVNFTFEEELFNKYMELRKVVSLLENIKYDAEDEMKDKEAFKQGFLAGVKVMSSVLLDI